MAFRSRFLLGCVLIAAFCRQPAYADTLKITSTPPGATVEINGIVVGITPYEEEVPGGYFHRTKTALGRRLQNPMAAHISLAGYTVKEIQMTEGPMNWVSLKGHSHGEYWLLKSKHFHVELEPISKAFTGNIVADIPSAEEQPRNADAAPTPPIENVIAQAKPAVVRLKGLAKSGSGFFVTEKGVIATNAHVARGEGALLAILPDGQQLSADILYIDPDRDIALVKVEGDAFPYLSLAAAGNVRQGETVIAIGNPGGAMPFAVTKGIVSAVGKFSAAGPGIWIQTDANINPGNSGGPLLNARGQAIGINTLKLEKKNVSGIGFALSASDLLAVLLKYYPNPLSPTGKELLSSPEASVPGKSSPTEQAVGTVRLDEPTAAEVFVDGKFAGDVPWSAPLAAGQDYVIVVRTPGRADWIKRIYVFAGMTTTLTPWPQ